MAASTRVRKRRPSAAKQDSYEVVTDLIIEALEAGVVPWHKPWRSTGEGLPKSLSSLKPYRGVNVWTLSVTALLRGYESQWWGTYKQITDRGGQVRKGEKGTPVVFWRVLDKPDPDDPLKRKSILLLKHFVVFNADQADDVKVPTPKEIAEVDPIAPCQEIADGYVEREPVKLRHIGDRACYSPATDVVTMPKIGQFDSAEHYYGTLFHELGHSTGHESRLKRPGIVDVKPFGTPDYSREELVAEMTAAFLCGEAGIDPNIPHHAGYIANWLEVLRGDKKAVVSASGAAQKAADLILGREPEAPKEEGS